MQHPTNGLQAVVSRPRSPARAHLTQSQRAEADGALWLHNRQAGFCGRNLHFLLLLHLHSPPEKEREADSFWPQPLTLLNYTRGSHFRHSCWYCIYQGRYRRRPTSRDRVTGVLANNGHRNTIICSLLACLLQLISPTPPWMSVMKP